MATTTAQFPSEIELNLKLKLPVVSQEESDHYKSDAFLADVASVLSGELGVPVLSINDKTNGELLKALHAAGRY